MGRNVLVTGAAGYIGNLAVNALAADPGIDKVVAYDLRATDAAASITITGDITVDDLSALLLDQQIDTVVHLASVLKPPVGAPADLVWFDADAPFVMDRATLQSKSRNTPFDGMRMQGKVLATYVAGVQVFEHA